MERQDYIEFDNIDLRALLKTLQKWKWLIAAITLVSVVTMGILSFLVLPPVYQSKTVIMVKQYQDPKTSQRQEQRDDLESAVDALSRLPVMTIKTYVGQMKNEALMRNVIDTLKLDNDLYTPDSLAGLIEVETVQDTNLIELSVKNTDPKLAAKIANTISEKFLEFVGAANEKQLVMSSDFLSKQLKDKNKELAEAMKNLNKNRNQPRNVAYLEQEVQNKNSNLVSLQSQLLQVEADYQQVLAGKTAAEQRLKTIPEKIRIKKIDVETGRSVDIEEVNPSYTEISQLAVQKSVQLAELDARRASINGVVNTLQDELKTLQSELNSKKETEAQLQEKVDQVKQTRDILAEKLTQVQVIKSVNLSQTTLQIVTPAFPPEKPVSPKKLLNMAAALLVGLMVSVGLAFILDIINNTINKADDIEQHLGIPLLGTIPFASREEFE